jgi:serine/threonine protein kinase
MDSKQKWSFPDDTDILDKRYRVVDKIGSGAFGEIYRVEKKVSKEMFAMKVEVPTKD